MFVLVVWGGRADSLALTHTLVPPLVLQAAIVLQGQKRPDGQWYLLHYDGVLHGCCRGNCC